MLPRSVPFAGVDLSERAARRRALSATTVGAAVTSERSAFGPGFPGLLDAARAGAPWALEAIYVELHPRVLAFMAGRAPREAEDLASEVFVSVAEGLSRFDGDERQLRAWVFTIAYRRLSDLWRRSHRRPTEPVETAKLDEVVGAGDTEAEAVDALSSAEALRRIAALPSPQAEVVLLRVVADLPVEEVAAILGKRPGTVRVIQHRALTRLARLARAGTDGEV